MIMNEMRTELRDRTFIRLMPVYFERDTIVDYQVSVGSPFTLSTEHILHFAKEETLYCSVYTYDSISDIAYHDHSGDFELSLVTQGYGYHYINNTVREVSVGEVVLIDPDSFHSFFPVDKENSTRLQVLNFVFSRGAFKELEPLFPQLGEAFDFLGAVSDHHPLYRSQNNLGRELSDYCQSLLVYMAKNYNRNYEANTASVLLTMAAILLEICRVFSRKEIRKGESDVPALVQKAMRYIAEHYLDPNFSISQIYDHLYVSKSHLCALFREHTDTTPVRHLNMLRVQRACKIMRKGMACPDDLYSRVGYNEYNTFYINFKKFTGFNLRDYVKALQICMPTVRNRKMHHEKPASTGAASSVSHPTAPSPRRRAKTPER